MRGAIMMKWIGMVILALACSTAWGLDLGQELKKSLKESVQQKIAPPAGSEQGESKQSSGEQVGSLLAGLGKTSQEEEVAIGRQIAGNLLGAAPLVKDKKLQKYVNNVGRWVASQSERPDLPWHFGVIESNDINAFAAPGGYIFLTRGLYRLLGSEAELAGVLAHEVGHVIRQHHLKILQQSRLIDLGGKLLAKKTGDNSAAQKLIGSGAEVVARSLDKSAELEADRIAVVLSTRAGYDAFGLPEVLQQMGHFAKDDGNVALLFKTHPHPDDRLDKLGVAMGSQFDSIKGQALEKRFYRIK